MKLLSRSLTVVAATAGALAFAAAPAAGVTAPVRATAATSVGGSSGAFTYDATQLPVGARLSVTAVYPGNGTSIVTLHVKGAVADRDYGAHAHVAACTDRPLDAGGHFQFTPFPDGSSASDPAYANPSNEVWLDLRTDDDGNGHAKAVVPWQPGDRRPMSVVVHAMHTATAPGSAGTAGARLGCLSVGF